ncbi:MAG: tetratricopeptide repeat protein [Nitrospirae bacterium]|nr:tetratricopeptide repeat protein [Nitrospirota bacterium]
MNDGQYIKYLRERLKAEPESKLFLSYAEELRKQDMVEDAMFILKDGTKKNPDFTAARLTLGRLYVSMNMLREAKKEFSEAAEMAPDNFHAHRRLAEVYKMLGDDANAAAEYMKALEINPFDFVSSNALGSMETVIQQSSEEEDPVFETLLEENISLAEEASEQIQGEAVIAAPVLEQELETPILYAEAEELPIEPSAEAEDNFSLAQRFVSEGDYKEAMDVYKEMLSEDPQDVRALQGLEDLKTLVQFSGMDKDVLLDRLNKFLDAVHRRFPAEDKHSVIAKLERFLDGVNMRFGREGVGRERVFAETAD